jgi:hypothetical protein
LLLPLLLTELLLLFLLMKQQCCWNLNCYVPAVSLAAAAATDGAAAGPGDAAVRNAELLLALAAISASTGALVGRASTAGGASVNVEPPAGRTTAVAATAVFLLLLLLAVLLLLLLKLKMPLAWLLVAELFFCTSCWQSCNCCLFGCWRCCCDCC